MATIVTVALSDAQEPNYLWDTTWNGQIGDWAPDAPGGSGGFRANAPLHTAILLCLMSDRRAEKYDYIPDGTHDPRGWAGDAIDPTIAPLGSRLWQLMRRELTQATVDLAKAFAQEALQTLVDQSAVASFTVDATANMAAGRLELAISMFRVNGTLSAAMNFWLMWDNESKTPTPLAP